MQRSLTEKSQLLDCVEKRRSVFALDSLPVQKIISAISDKGDEAVREFTKKFDGVDVLDLRVSDEILLEAKVQSDSKLQLDRKSTRLNSSHIPLSRMPSSA